MKFNTKATPHAVVKKIWNIFSLTVVILAVLCAVFLMGSRLFGYRVFTVVTGSMEPAFRVGDLLYVKQVDPNEITVGTPITFVLNEKLTVATHRVVQIDKENQRFYTKGDANDTVDAPIHFNNLVGVPQFSIPYLGYISDYVQHPPGTYVTLAIGIVLIAAVFLPDVFKKQEDKEDAQKADEPQKEGET